MSDTKVMDAQWSEDPRLALQVGPDFDLSALDRGATPGWTHGKKLGKKFRKARGDQLEVLQEQLYAQGRNGGAQRVLIVAQGLDTAGKGGLARHVMGMVDPQGVALKAFKAPTKEEREEHFLARIRRALPDAGMIGFFDRSHYEDILVPASLGMEEDELLERVHTINQFEKELSETGDCTIIKIALMVSYQEQGERLMERLERPDKHWKYSPGDLETRAKWDDFQRIYQWMLTRTSTDYAPWLVVPADHKWYARLALTEALTRSLEEMNLEWPAADFDVEEQKRLLSQTMSPYITK